MLILCLFLFLLISDLVVFKSFPYIYFGLVILYIFNDFLFDAVFGDKMPRDYFYRLGLSQRYMLPLGIVFIYLFFKFNPSLN